MSAVTELRTTKVVDGKVDWRVIAPFFWQWYHDHANDMIVKKKILVLRITIRVRDLYFLFVQLFGPEPESRAVISELSHVNE